MASDQPLRLALLWHMHQPDYRLHDHVLLPWTRLHAIKDYSEMLCILADHPEMRCTVNFVPSLLRQIRGYAREGWTDEVRELCRCHASDLSPREVQRLAYWAGILPPKRMVTPYPRFEQLIGIGTGSAADLSEQDIRDLQVWYMLAWTGSVLRESEGLGQLIEQGKNYSEDQKTRLADLHDWIVDDLYTSLPSFNRQDHIEFSTTPFYHPILPLLIDLEEGERAEPGTPLPATHSGWIEDVDHQLDGSIRFHHQLFGTSPTGCWPSEGSLSSQTLDALIRAGFRWTASDQFLLEKTRGVAARPFDHCFPWTWNNENGSVSIFFRDHDLSDRIGFVYSGMNPEEAVADFVGRVLQVREEILEEYGPDGLAEAVLPVILDGENCWEWYPDNGRPFLELLYAQLVEHRLIEPICMGDAVPEEPDEDRVLEQIEPGSWIGGNFRIWIGGSEENHAWEALAETREELMRHRDRVPSGRFLAAWEQLLAAEGSDWFWWYSDENSSANDADFDALFRHRLQAVYRELELAPPTRLDTPLISSEHHHTGTMQPAAMHRATFDRTDES